MLSIVAASFFLALEPAAGGAAPVPAVNFEFTLGDTTGPRASSFDRLSYDRLHEELYAANSSTVVVYKKGFEIFRFTVGNEIGGVTGVAVFSNGEFLVLSPMGGLFRCNYRGKLIRPVPLIGVPDTVGGFQASALQIVGGKVYLLDKAACRLMVVTEDGRFVSFRDLLPLIAKKKDKRSSGADINGFSVDEQGNVLFTVPTLFTAYVLSPKGELKSFGTRGSREGQFGVVGGIARDERGIIYVTDLLRCVVMLFDSEFQFLAEVGGRGDEPGDLIAPSFLAVGGGWVFVSQGGDRGISAFRVN